MTAHRTVKARRRPRARLVGVVTGAAELGRAVAMSRPPDFFELRLDHLIDLEKQLGDQIPLLPAPLIITARHPREGGANSLPARQRRDLLLRFLDRAAYVDIELRSFRWFGPVFTAARKKDVRLILSFHDLDSTPSLSRLSAKALAAKKMGADIFKVATRTDTSEQLNRLVTFTTAAAQHLAVSAMGLGPLGTASRILLARAGSVLLYAAMGRPRFAGQPSLDELRAALAAAE